MFSHLQGRFRALFLVSLILVTVVVSSLTVWRLFASNRFDQIGGTGGPGTQTSNQTPQPVLSRWSDPATWQGKLPTAGSAVTIPAGKTVLLDTSPPSLKSLSIQGTLICKEQDLTLSANWIMVAPSGTLQCGTEAQPFQHSLTIVLTGNNTKENIMDMGTKLLGVEGGKLDLHGQSKVSWVHLGATAGAGAKQITLEKDVNWSKGDRLVIASTDYNPLQAEEVTISSVSGKTVTLQQSLKYMHWGQIQNYAGKVVDERAEVGLLSHNIVVRGDNASVQNGFGGQSMFMRGSTVHIDSVEFYHMGQFKHLARYPVHWHLAGDAKGNYIQNSTIDHSFNRCITIHGTNDLLIRNNVTFNTIGHCYFMEDGAEVHNVLDHNLGVETLKPADGQNLLPSDVRPATFWITNPNNTFTGNVAAGSESQGFWFALPEHPTGLESNRTDIWPRQTPLGTFKNNVAHSNGETGLFVDDGPSNNGYVDGYYYAPSKSPGKSSYAVDAIFQNFTAYKQGFLGVWMRGYYLHLKGAILADNGDGAIFACNKAYLEDSLVVGETSNMGTPGYGEARGLDGRSLPTPWDPATPLAGFSFYDGVIGVKNVTFVNFVSNKQRPAGGLSYHRDNGNAINVQNYVQGIHFVNANPVYLAKPTRDGDKASVFLDADGSVTGQAGQYVTANNPILADNACTFKASWNSYVCRHHYTDISIESEDGAIAPLTLTRDDGVNSTQNGADSNFVSVSALPGHTYTWDFASNARTLQIDFLHTKSGDWVELALSYPSNKIRVYRDAEQSRKITAATSMDDFNASKGNKYYYDSASSKLYVKLIPQNGNDWARVNIVPA